MVLFQLEKVILEYRIEEESSQPKVIGESKLSQITFLPRRQLGDISYLISSNY